MKNMANLKAAFYILSLFIWIFIFQEAEMKNLNVGVNRISERSQIPASIWKEIAKMNTTEFIKHYVRRPSQHQAVNASDPLSRNISDTLFPPSVDAGDEAAAAPDDQATELVAGLLSPPDEGCQPRMVGFRLPKSDSPDVVHWPECVPLYQCGGCCGNEMLECSPASIKTVEIFAMKVRYLPESQTFIYEGTETFLLNDHLSCDCRCRVKPHHCHKAKHVYDEDNCRCKCRNDQKALTCLSYQKWDDSKCECVCRDETDCHDNEYFNTYACSCAKMVEVDPLSNQQCAGAVCRAGYAAVLNDQGDCECRQSNDWGDTAPANLPGGGSNVNVPDQSEEREETTTTTPTTRRPRPRPSRRRMIPGGRRRPRREINIEDYLE